MAESSALVNQLSEQSREDAVRFARDELAEAEAHLRDVRQELADFRRDQNIVDPTADVASQSGLLNALNQELAQALVERDVLPSYAAEGDQRVIQANRRIDAITDRIEAERRTLGVTGVTGSLPEVIGRYEELSIDLEFANTAYTQALAGLAAARAEARRQSRYLAPHVSPTLANTRALPAPGAARRADRLLPAAGLGRADADLLQRARQPVSAGLPAQASAHRFAHVSRMRDAMTAATPIRRKATNLSLEAELVAEARRLGISLSRAAEEGLRRAVAEAAKRRWQEENREALLSSNAYVEKHGLPLAKYRLF